jgi:hypothetical protein
LRRHAAGRRNASVRWLEQRSCRRIGPSRLPRTRSSVACARACRHRRTLQGEVLAILEETLRSDERLGRDEVLAEVRRLGLHTPSESASRIRADRETRRGRRRPGDRRAPIRRACADAISRRQRRGHSNARRAHAPALRSISIAPFVARQSDRDLPVDYNPIRFRRLAHRPRADRLRLPPSQRLAILVNPPSIETIAFASCSLGADRGRCR